MNQIRIGHTHLNLQNSSETKLADYNRLVRLNCKKIANCEIDSMAVCASNSSIDDDVKNMTVVFENKCVMYGFNCQNKSCKLKMNLLNFVLQNYMLIYILAIFTEVFFYLTLNPNY